MESDKRERWSELEVWTASGGWQKVIQGGERPPPGQIEERGEVELGNRARVMGGVSLRGLPGCLLLQHPPH